MIVTMPARSKVKNSAPTQAGELFGFVFGGGWRLTLDDFDFGIGFENATSYPAPGQVLLYPGGFSETEILFPYGSCCFASKMGQLAGNHFLTVVDGLEHLSAIGKMCLWEGAQEIVFEQA